MRVEAKRLTSAFLALVLTMGMLPTLSAPALAAEPPQGIPKEIYLSSVDYDGTPFQSPNGLGTCTLHNFTVTDRNGYYTSGFCMNHKLALNSGKKAAWVYEKTFAHGELASQPFLDWYTFWTRKSEALDQQYPGSTEDQKSAIAEGEGWQYWGVWTRMVSNGWVQGRGMEEVYSASEPL